MTCIKAEKLDQMIEVMSAYRDGKQIECRPKGSTKEKNWVQATCPNWDWFSTEYRVKEDRYSIGDIYCYSNDGRTKTSERYILAQLTVNDVALVSLESGNRWNDPKDCVIRSEDCAEANWITRFDFNRITNNQIVNFIKVS